jgi:demethylmenaquinone methyltransferase/2-methoxy-6-polyprenyl-1,4-benzoquinol methylase
VSSDRKRSVAEPVEPHPVMPAYYGKKAQRAGFVRHLFNETAPHYDRINRLFSIGSGAWYRRHCLRRAGLQPGMRLLDVAVGTGLVAREAVGLCGMRADVIGLDLSESMLAQARRSLDVPLIQGMAEDLPLADASVDFITMGYALRHVADLTVTFREFHRVLRPGGTVLLLEISRPTHLMTWHAMSVYLGWVVPMMSRLTGGGASGRTLMRYYWETIDQCVAPEVITQAMTGAGFAQVRCDVEFDMFRNYSGRKDGRGVP